MQENYSKIQAAGLGLAAISYDSPAILKTFAARRSITFPLLSDTDSKIIRSYGILNTSLAPNSPQYGIPNPGIYFVDQHGRVKAKYFEDDFRERQTAAVILMRQFGIQPATKHDSITAKHLSVRTSASRDAARMGQHLALMLDVDLPPRVHVYAPGVHDGYIPIDWKQNETPAAKSGSVAYPAAKTIFLEVINEKVPVFQGHFRLTRDLILGTDKDLASAADPSGNVTFSGTFRYQACDDEKCFVPETVPLSWTLHFEPLDRVRAK